MSISATGQFAHSMTFDKRGYVREYIIPPNPKLPDQGDARQILAAVQAVLKLLIDAAITAIKAQAPTPYRWNSYAVKVCIGALQVTWLAGAAAWAILTTEQKGTWDTAFSDVFVHSIGYKGMDEVTSGQAAFQVAFGMFTANIITAPGTPGTTNASAWATALIP